MRTSFALLLAASCGFSRVPACVAQNVTKEAPRADIPFGVGEEAGYRLSYTILGRVGRSALEVVRLDTVRGFPVYRLLFTLEGKALWASVKDRYESSLDLSGTYSHAFSQNVHELDFKRVRTRDFFPTDMRWSGKTNNKDESGTLASALPLDELSFLFFVRTLNLEVGREYEFHRYWANEGNPIILKVLRRETVQVPAGKFNAIVIQPIIKTRGLFSEGGEAEVYIAEESPRPIVKLRVKLSFGTLDLQLEKFVPGMRIAQGTTQANRE